MSRRISKHESAMRAGILASLLCETLGIHDSDQRIVGWKEIGDRYASLMEEAEKGVTALEQELEEFEKAVKTPEQVADNLGKWQLEPQIKDDKENPVI